jgi:hypothetical protein
VAPFHEEIEGWKIEHPKTKIEIGGAASLEDEKALR